MPKKPHITLYEAERKGRYHEHWRRGLTWTPPAGPFHTPMSWA